MFQNITQHSMAFWKALQQYSMFLSVSDTIPEYSTTIPNVLERLRIVHNVPEHSKTFESVLKCFTKI